MSTEKDRRIEHLERERTELQEQLMKSNQQVIKLMEVIVAIKRESEEAGYKLNTLQKFYSGGLESFLNCSPKLNQGDVRIPDQEMTEINYDFERKEIESILEERLQALEDERYPHVLDAKKLLLVPDLKIPSKFKVPNFEKYDGSSCPKEHITTYCRMMTGWQDNDELLMHCFQYSLTGSARTWYNQLIQSEAKTWKQLARAFIEQYEIMLNPVLDRLDLRDMKKKETESFRRYAQRWIDVASQVQPPLTEMEKSSIFMGTLDNYYCEELVRIPGGFTDKVRVGELVETMIKKGKWRVESNRVVKSAPDNDTSGRAPSAYNQSHPVCSIKVIHTHPSEGQQGSYDRKPKRRRYKDRVITIPMLYTKLLPLLLEAGLLTKQEPKLFQPSDPSEYNANESCDYHSGCPGHSTEDCNNLKYKVRDLMKAGFLKFDNGEAIILAVD